MITAVQTQAYRATGDKTYLDHAATEAVVYLVHRGPRQLGEELSMTGRRTEQSRAAAVITITKRLGGPLHGRRVLAAERHTAARRPAEIVGGAVDLPPRGGRYRVFS